MFKIYKDVFFGLYVTLWLIVTVGAFIITGTATVSIIVNYIMMGIMGIIIIIRYRNDKFYNWLETPLK